MSGPLYPPGDFGEAFDAAAARLRAAVAASCARPGPWPARVRAAIEAVLEFAAADPAAARLLLVEPWAHGDAGTGRRERLHDRFAALLASGREELPGGEELPGLTEQVLVAAVAAILGRRLAPDGEREPPLPTLAPELVEFVLLPYIGHARARVWARLRVDFDPRRLASGEEKDVVHPVEFTEVLARLQGMIGTESQVVINLLGNFFDCGFYARLERVETLSRRERAEAALRAVPTHYDLGEEGITDAISDLTHLAAKQGVDVDALLARCRRNFEAEAAAAGERPLRRYALLVVVEAASPEQAWESVSGLLGGLEGDGEPDCVYVGAPWQGVPADAEDLSTESVRVGFSLPAREDDGFLAATKELRPCE